MKPLVVIALFSFIVRLGIGNTFADDFDNPDVPDSPDEPSDTNRSNDVLPQQTVRVALVDSGVNYQLPLINTSLARDDSGHLIGYDFWDLDNLPFDSHPLSNGAIQRHGTRTASILLREAPFVELVPYRYPRPDMQRMTQLIEHANSHGVKVIGLAVGGPKREPWQAFETAALAHPHILFVVSAGNNGRNIDTQAVYPAAMDIPNMLVVTSADDFAKLASGVNWGRNSVDYMVPAEHVQALHFDGEHRAVAGSSYAVPKVVALAARFLRSDPSLDASDVIKKIRSKFANGLEPKRLGQGYLYDPQFDELSPIEVKLSQMLQLNDSSESLIRAQLSLHVLVVDEAWHEDRVRQIMQGASSILSQCELSLNEIQVDYLDVPDYLRDLETGATRTLMQAARVSGRDRKLTVVLGRDTLMSEAFEAEAFGRGNTRSRPWLTDAVWVTSQAKPADVVLAHELVHVLTNSGDHSRAPLSLMNAFVSRENTQLSKRECALIVQRASTLGLLER